MIDSHTHLFLCEQPAEDLVAAAAEAGVNRMLNVGLGDSSNEEAIAAAESHDAVFATVGCHPTAADGFDGDVADRIRELAAHDKVRAVGETGLDYYRETATPTNQRDAFEAQIEIGLELGLPIVIHARDKDGESRAIDEIFATLDAQAPGHPVVLHCFSAPDRVGDAIERGWYCSFAGNVTYPKSDDLRAAAAQLPDHLILVETDAPYLTPQEMRVERNQPANVVSTAGVVAEARGVPYRELERQVEANAGTVFGW